jgi:hypothetical protein
MSTLLEFDEKKFLIALFSIVARREAARESTIRKNLASKSQLEPKNRHSYEQTNFRVAAQPTGRVLHRDLRVVPDRPGDQSEY